MERVLTCAFDRLTIEEINPLCAAQISTEIDREILARIREHVLERISTRKSLQDDASHVLKSRNSSRKRIKLTRTLLIAAIIALLVAASALAVALGGSQFLASLFGGENYDLVEQYIMADLAQVSDEKLNLTLESALSDGHLYYVVFSVNSQDGSDLGERFPDVDFDFVLEKPSRVKPGFQLERLETGESTDGLAFIALIRSSQGPISSMRMTLTRMISIDGSLEEISSDLTVEADFKPCPIAAGGDDESVFRSIELSPFALWIDVYEAWEENDSLSAGIPIYDVFLVNEDGTQVGAKAEQFSDQEYMEEIGWGGSQYPNGTHQSYISIRFARFVEISKIKAVVINGQEYLLSTSEL